MNNNKKNDYIIISAKTDVLEKMIHGDRKGLELIKAILDNQDSLETSKFKTKVLNKSIDRMKRKSDGIKI